MKLILLSALGAAISPVFASVVARQSGSKGKLTPVTVKGNAFFAGDERFYVRGVAYQPGLSSTANAERMAFINTQQVVQLTLRTLSSISRG
jgi:hypothetical protein